MKSVREGLQKLIKLTRDGQIIFQMKIDKLELERWCRISQIMYDLDCGRIAEIINLMVSQTTFAQ